MTYRNSSIPSQDDLVNFTNFLNQESKSSGNKELQPWIPFCEGRCTFCYFPVTCERDTINLYMEALKKALSAYASSRYVKSSVFSEIYVGGGSPSVLARDQIVDMLKFLRETFTLSDDCSVKFTASTNNLSKGKICSLAANKVDQLDIGIQTFNDSLRQILLLRDNGVSAKEKLKIAKDCGLRVSIDLLYNLPSQTTQQWLDDVKQALELDVESVDCYPLELYSETALARKISSRELPPPGDDEKELEMYLEAYDLFKEHGYLPTCHNRFSRIKDDFKEASSEVVGTGAGFFMGNVGRYIFSDIEDVKKYIATVVDDKLPIARLTTASIREEMLKSMMLLYIREPVDGEKFKAQFGLSPEEAFPVALKKLHRKGLVETLDGKIYLTEKGDPWRVNVAWEFFNNIQH